MKYALIALVVLSYLWDVVGVILSVKRQKKPLPDCVSDVYDAETYARWRAYTAERRRFGLITAASPPFLPLPFWPLICLRGV